jgi:hypothetical protein
VNFLSKPQSAEHFASAWPKDVFEKLTDLRRRYDPDGILAMKLG